MFAIAFAPLACAVFSALAQAASPADSSSSAWPSIRAAWVAEGHAAYRGDDGYHARNPGQSWTTRFDGRGFTVAPDRGTWTWGLELVRYGFARDEHDIGGTAPVCADGARVSYRWDPLVTEWYLNDARGLEHGYTVHERPARASGPLSFTLALRGDLRPVLDEDRKGVTFVDDSGAATVLYTGLSVIDSDGRPVPARLALATDGLRIEIDEANARYPLTVDPTAQQAYIKASNTEGDDQFGFAIAISGDTAVVGAPFEDSDATGVGGAQNNNNAADSGAAYVFVRSGTTWTQQAYLKASNSAAADSFGTAVAVIGDTAVVGAPGEDSNATGIGGDETDNNASASGASYVFVRAGANWTQQAYVKASNTGANDTFGESVAIGTDTAVVGAQFEDSNGSGVGAAQNNDDAQDSGAAYVFVRSGAAWTQEAYVKASNTGAGDRFGYPVAISGETVAIGARREDSSSTGVNGSQFVNDANDSGAAYVFLRSGTSWSQQSYLKASNTGVDDGFGSALAVAGDRLAVGAPQEDSSATGVHGTQAGNGALDSGAVYSFVRGGTNWSQQAYVKASNTSADDHFGFAVALAGDTILVGAYGEDSNATGIGGSQTNNDAGNAGAAYAIVAAAEDYLTYCFGDDLDPVITALCPCFNFGSAGHGCSNSFSSIGGLLTATGSTAFPNTILFTASDLPNNNLTTGLRTTTNAIPGGFVQGDGLRCQTGTLIRFGAHNSGTGGDVPNSWTSGTAQVVAGITRYYQVLYRNPTPTFCPVSAGGDLFNITNGVIIVW